MEPAQISDMIQQRIVICHPSIFSAMEIEEFERQILANPKATERDASEFFARYPKFLFLGIGKRVLREITLINSRNGLTYRVDFFRENFGDKQWDIIELKSPQASFISGEKGGHPKPSSEVIKAINQAEDYRDLILEDAELRAKLLLRGISVYRPQLLVVVGRNQTLPNAESLVRLHDRLRRGPVEALSYDDVYQFAKEHYESNSLIVLPASMGSSREELSPDVFFEKMISAVLQAELGGLALPFSGRGLHWRIDKTDVFTRSVVMTVFVRRELEKMMVMEAFGDVFKEKLPDVRPMYCFDETSFSDMKYRVKRKLDGD